MRAFLTNARRKVQQRVDGWRQRMRQRRLWRIIELTLQRGLSKQSFDLAGSVAFWAFFSLFPLLLGLIAGFSYFFDSTQVQERLIARATEALPAAGPLLEKNLSAVIQLRRAFGAAAILGLLWSASAGFSALSRAVNWGWGSEAPPPRLLRLRLFLMAFSLYFLLMAVFVLSTVLRLFRAAEIRFVGSIGLSTPLLSGLLSALVLLLPQFLVFSLIYRFLTYDKVRLADIWPSALLATVLFETSKQLFLLYLEHFDQYKVIYGSVASVILLQLWLFLIALIVITSGAFGRARLLSRDQLG